VIANQAHVKNVSVNMINECKTTKKPVELDIKLSRHNSLSNKYEKEEMRNVPYRQLIGSLMYVALATRPHILYRVIHFNLNRQIF